MVDVMLSDSMTTSCDRVPDDFLVLVFIHTPGVAMMNVMLR